MKNPVLKLFTLILFICALCTVYVVKAEESDCDEDDLTDLDYSKCWPVPGGWKCRK